VKRKAGETAVSEINAVELVRMNVLQAKSDVGGNSAGEIT
jgi:hypothetical protein